MRLLYPVVVIALLILWTAPATAQDIDGLSRDDSGRYEFKHSSVASGVSKSLLYERLKSFVVVDLDAADTRISWDEQGRDSIKTIAFIDLGNSPEVMNQMVNCIAHLSFTDGEAVLRLSSFNYNGTRSGTAQQFSAPLHRLEKLPYNARLWTMAVFSETLRQLMVRMDAVALGAR